MVSDTIIRGLADQLWQADRTAVPIAPLTDQHPDLVIEDAYAIQSHNIQRRVTAGSQMCGRKVGLTSRPMQQLLGVAIPCALGTSSCQERYTRWFRSHPGMSSGRTWLTSVR